jgi:MauM/NapG family ferredoxin protein
MLGLLSWKKPLRIRTGTPCTGCGECAIHCKMEAIEIERKESGATIRVDNRECILCSDCIDRCPTQVLGYAWGGPGEQAAPIVDLPRRRVAAALPVGALAAPAIRRETALPAKKRAVLRPPNSVPEEEFLNRCIRCGACIKVCPTSALHPAFLEAGPGGMFSPLLIPRIGYCSYECTLCGQVCPTGAIPFFTPERKQARSIGYAMFDKNRCIPYREYKDCLVCEEHCPVSPKAIVFVRKEALLEDGSVRTLKFPDVKPERCVGCGVCENVCPLDGASAIRVQPYRPQKTLEEIARTRGGHRPEPPLGGQPLWRDITGGLAVMEQKISDDAFNAIIYKDAKMHRLIALARRVAASDAVVLITGETARARKCSPGPSTWKAPGELSPWWRSTAPRFPSLCWSPNSSGMKRARLPGLTRRIRGASSRRMGVRCSSTRSAT